MEQSPSPEFKWRLVDDGTAIFHQFSQDYEEFESGAGNYAVAIVERDDGSVQMVRADRIKFIERESA